MRNVRFGTVGRLLVAGLTWGGAVGCAGSVTDLPSDLPAQLALRSDTPYMTGTIVSRSVAGGGAVRLLVRARSSDASRVPEALVTVVPDALVLWPDGTEASIAALVVGQRVTVWVTGAELRSLPPQVGGNAFLLFH